MRRLRAIVALLVRSWVALGVLLLPLAAGAQEAIPGPGNLTVEPGMGSYRPLAATAIMATVYLLRTWALPASAPPWAGRCIAFVSAALVAIGAGLDRGAGWTVMAQDGLQTGLQAIGAWEVIKPVVRRAVTPGATPADGSGP